MLRTVCNRLVRCIATRKDGHRHVGALGQVPASCLRNEEERLRTLCDLRYLSAAPTVAGCNSKLTVAHLRDLGIQTSMACGRHVTHRTSDSSIHVDGGACMCLLVKRTFPAQSHTSGSTCSGDRLGNACDGMAGEGGACFWWNLANDRK